MTSTPEASDTPQEKAAALRALHVAGDPLVLPNAWDAASARMVEAAGFPVVATSSYATAVILGYDDGEKAPVEEVLAAAARIVRAVSVPGLSTSSVAMASRRPSWSSGSPRPGRSG
jgi:2-methylisocitrate lyase-like PEP mutase family enzyme